jgi:hypothetical protein
LGGEDSHSGMLGLDPEPENPPFPFSLRLEYDRCSRWDFSRMIEEGALPVEQETRISISFSERKILRYPNPSSSDHQLQIRQPTNDAFFALG